MAVSLKTNLIVLSPIPQEEVAIVYWFVTLYAKQKHLGCKKVRGQSEATLLTGMCDQKL